MTRRDRHVPVAYGQGYTKLCRLCRERIWMLPKQGGGWLAVNLRERPDGNIVLDGFGRGYVLPPGVQPGGERLFVAHQATCGPYLELQRQRSQDAAQMRLGDDA